MKLDKSKSVKIIGIVVILLFVFFMAFNYPKKPVTTKEISYNEFISLLDEKQILKVLITSENLTITPSEDNTVYKGKTLYTANINDENLISKLQEAGVDYEGKNLKEISIYNMMLTWIMPIGIMCIILIIPIAIIILVWRFLLLKKENKNLRIQIKDLLEKKDEQSNL